MINHGLTIADAERLLDSVVEFPEIESAFERIRPITDFRKDDNEARILYLCRRVQVDATKETIEDKSRNLYILKCKIQ